MSTKVTINYDISKYLPSTSETKIGMNIMDKNFDEIKESELNVMFKNLNSQEKENIKNSLEKIKGVDSVDYDGTQKYNNKEYTLYILNVKDTSNSKTSNKVYEKVTNDYKDYKVSLSGTIAENNKPVLQMWIVVFAVVCAMIILIIMCESYTEPFLILFVILLAIAMNKGTNIIFKDVSHITNAIAAILQMALSMDYSIMLLNRYKQEKINNKSQTEAMKTALYKSCKAISGSSITTIVGLLALVFMSFTIGKDLGFVLAKGVLFSLISIFLCLPALIILFDKLITKTSKKTVNIKLNWLGKFSHKFRYPLLILFLLLFGASYFLKSGIGILYTDIEMDEVAKHFKENNQMAVIYNNKYDSDITKLCTSFNNQNVDQVLCYGNTINQKLTYDKLPKKLEDLNEQIDIEDSLLKIIYYNYYNENKDIEMTYDEFINFIENNIYTDDKLNEKITINTKNSLNRLKYFTNKSNINKLRNKNNISNILELDKEKVEDLFVLYNTKQINTSLSLNEFIDFINKSVINDKKYSSFINNDQKDLIEKVSIFTNKKVINSNLNEKELSNLFKMNEEDVKKLLLLYYMNTDTSYEMDLKTFISSAIYLKNNTSYLDNINIDKLTSLSQVLNNQNNINMTKLNRSYLTNYFKNINSSLVDKVYEGMHLEETLFTPYEFVCFTLDKMDNYLSEQDKENLKIIKFVMEESVKTVPSTYTSSQIKKLLNIKDNSITNLYALIMWVNNYEYKLSPVNFVNLILENKDNELIKNKISSNLDNLYLLNTVMNSVNNNKNYNFSEMAELIKANKTEIKLLYSLYEIKNTNKNVTISLYDFSDFIINEVSKNPKYASSIKNSDLNKLKSIRKIMNSSLNKISYNSDELFNTLSKLNDDLDKNMVDLVYIYNGSINYYDDSYELTIEQFANYLNDNILKDSRFKLFIDEKMENKIRDAKKNVDESKKLLVSKNYSRMIINTTYKLEGDKTFDFVQNIKDQLKSKNKEIYLVGNSPMAYDMSGSFNSELNFITVLTIVAIYVVVAITFKSLLIPLILVSIIQAAVYITMGILSVTGSEVYFIALLIVQSILMGATIDYAIVYTSYYKESRKKMNVLDSIKNSYNRSIHTILTSALILIIVTLVVGNFASAIAAKICITVSKGTTCAVILVLFILPAVLAISDKFICRETIKK